MFLCDPAKIHWKPSFCLMKIIEESRNEILVSCSFYIDEKLKDNFQSILKIPIQKLEFMNFSLIPKKLITTYIIKQASNERNSLIFKIYVNSYAFCISIDVKFFFSNSFHWLLRVVLHNRKPKVLWPQMFQNMVDSIFLVIFSINFHWWNVGGYP